MSESEFRLRFRIEGREGEAALDRLRAATRGTSQGMDEAGKSARAAGTEMETKRRRAEALTGGLAGLDRNVIRLGASLLGGVGLVSAIRSSVTASMNFEASMSQVQAISGATGEDLERLTAIARHMGATTQFSASQAADGLRYLVMAGFDVNQSIAALPNVLNLAAAGAMDLGRAADITSNIMSAFNVPAERSGEIADALAASAQSANTDINQMGEALSYAGPIANALGYTVQDTAGAIAVLSNQGIQATRAGTSLNNIMIRLLNPTGAAKAAIEGLGLEVRDVSPEFNTLTEIVDRFREAGMGATESTVIFGQRGGPAMEALVSNAPDLHRLTGVINDSGDAAENTARIMRDNLRGDVNQLKSTIEAFNITAGESGMLGALRDVVQAMTTGLADNSEAVATRVGAAFALIVGAGEVMTGGLRVAFNGLQIMVGAVLANIIDMGARAQEMLSAITFGGVSERYRAEAENLRAMSASIRDGMREDMDDIVDASATAARGLDRIVGALADIAAVPGVEPVTENLEALADQAGLTAAQLDALGEGAEYGFERAADAGDKLEGVTRAVASGVVDLADDIDEMSGRAAPAVDAVTRAFGRLNVESTRALEEKAAKAEADYQLIRLSGVASARDIELAFLAMAKAQLEAAAAADEAGRKTALASLRAMAATDDQRKAVDALIAGHRVLGAEAANSGQRQAATVDQTSAAYEELGRVSRRAGDAAVEGHTRGAAAAERETQSVRELAVMREQASGSGGADGWDRKGIQGGGDPIGLDASFGNPLFRLLEARDQDLLQTLYEQLATASIQRGQGTVAAESEIQQLTQRIARGDQHARGELESRLGLASSTSSAPQQGVGNRRTVDINLRVGDGRAFPLQGDEDVVQRLIRELESGRGVSLMGA